MAYSRDETIAAITSFYRFLTKVHLPDSALKIPSEGGWPELTDEYLSFMGKTPTVTDLIRHMPFIDSNQEKPYMIHYRTVAVDFTGDSIRNSPHRYTAEPQEERGIT
ncbi:hypothetical protein AJ79_04202 [Helicocarpus griseus UAMH5409]|uniref:Uncharacterized protein n=1 Tax=Helicocarpus griseus UAMH5409 TaxID=1447875 RepID=A0A2B7XUX9_9EURO|nr:hypothetical protein AJ79_04202 [Helicocarpus griseus UAMH5409]